jgi:hypothetical protein
MSGAWNQIGPSVVASTLMQVGADATIELEVSAATPAAEILRTAAALAEDLNASPTNVLLNLKPVPIGPQ